MATGAQLLGIFLICLLIIGLISVKRARDSRNLGNIGSWPPRLPLALGLLGSALLLTYQAFAVRSSVRDRLIFLDDNIPSVRVFGVLTDPAPEGQSYRLQIHFDTITMDAGIRPEAYKTCIVSMSVQYSYMSAPSIGFGGNVGRATPGDELETDPAKPICITGNPRGMGLNFAINWDVPMPMYAPGATYFYPYDRLLLSPRIGMHAVMYDAAGSSIGDIADTVSITILVNLEGWEVQKIDGRTLELTRPRLYQILTPSLLVVALLCIVLLPYFPDPGSIGQVAVGLGLGLWAIRQALVPSSIVGVIAIDRILLGGFVLLAVSTVLSIRWAQLRKRNGVGT